MNEIYISPEKYGLREIGELDFSSGAYEFDLLVVWQDVSTRKFFMAEDSGCSCPLPFGGMGRADLTPTTPTQMRKRAQDRLRDRESWQGQYVTPEDIERLERAMRTAITS